MLLFSINFQLISNILIKLFGTSFQFKLQTSLSSQNELVFSLCHVISQYVNIITARSVQELILGSCQLWGAKSISNKMYGNVRVLSFKNLSYTQCRY